MNKTKTFNLTNDLKKLVNFVTKNDNLNDVIEKIKNSPVCQKSIEQFGSLYQKDIPFFDEKKIAQAFIDDVKNGRFDKNAKN